MIVFGRSKFSSVWKRQIVLCGNDEQIFCGNDASFSVETANRAVWKRRVVLCGNGASFCVETTNRSVWKRRIVSCGNDESSCVEMTNRLKGILSDPLEISRWTRL